MAVRYICDFCGKEPHRWDASKIVQICEDTLDHRIVCEPCLSQIEVKKSPFKKPF